MLDVLENIWGLITSYWDYFVTSVKGFGYMIMTVIQSLAIPPVIRPYLPSFFGIAITTVVVIAVIKAIFGR